MWVVGESLAERGVPIWFVGEQRRSFCGRSRWMVGGSRWVARELPRWVVRKFPSSEPRLTAEPGCLYCPPRKFPTLGKGKITDLRSPGQPGKSSPKRSPCGPKICEIFQFFWLTLLNFITIMKNGFQQTRDAVPRNSSSKRKKEILECDEFCLCEHVWTSVEAVRVQRIVAGFLRNINNVCGDWAIIEKGFKSFLLSLTQKPCIVNAFSDADDKLVFHLFCILLSIFQHGKSFSTATNNSPTYPNVNVGFVGFYQNYFFCLIGPKVSFWLAFHCTNYTKADNFTFF